MFDWNEFVGAKAKFSTRIGSIIRYSGTSFTKVKAIAS